jgi:hypothetical protein
MKATMRNLPALAKYRKFWNCACTGSTGGENPSRQETGIAKNK